VRTWDNAIILRKFFHLEFNPAAAMLAMARCIHKKGVSSAKLSIFDGTKTGLG
jgi:hypothetical protein